MTPEIQSRIAIYRAKIADGTITLDEMKQAVLEIRGPRRNAATSSDQAKRTKAKKVVQSADDMLKELEEGM